MKLVRNILRVAMAAATMTALMMAVLAAEAQAANQTQDKPSCSLMGEGIATAGWVKHRIFIDDQAIYGANDMSSVIAELKELRQSGRCQ